MYPPYVNPGVWRTFYFTALDGAGKRVLGAYITVHATVDEKGAREILRDELYDVMGTIPVLTCQGYNYGRIQYAG